MTTDTTHLLWCDLETNGSHKGAVVLEAAFALTDTEFNILWTWDGLIANTGDDVRDAHHDAPDVVRVMHAESELWDDLMGAVIQGTAYHISDADATMDVRLHEWLVNSNVQDHKIRLAGSGVSHFDSLLLKEQFPKVWSWIDGFEDSVFLKPTLDMGVIRRFLKMVNIEGLEYPSLPVGKPHRAYNDVMTFINDARVLTTNLKEIMYQNEIYHDFVDERKISRSD